MTGKSGKISDVINTFNAPVAAVTSEDTNVAPVKNLLSSIIWPRSII